MHQLALLYITFLIKKLRGRSRGAPTAGAPCHGTNGTMGNPALLMTEDRALQGILSRFYSCTTTRSPPSPLATIYPCCLLGSAFPNFYLEPTRSEKPQAWLLRIWFGIAQVNKLVSLTWLFRAMRSFLGFTLRYITQSCSQPNHDAINSWSCRFGVSWWNSTSTKVPSSSNWDNCRKRALLPHFGMLLNAILALTTFD